jgi:hypothetical protein
MAVSIGPEFSDDWFLVMAEVGRLARQDGLRFEISEAPDGTLLYSVHDDD